MEKKNEHLTLNEEKNNMFRKEYKRHAKGYKRHTIQCIQIIKMYVITRLEVKYLLHCFFSSFSFDTAWKDNPVGKFVK